MRGVPMRSNSTILLTMLTAILVLPQVAGAQERKKDDDMQGMPGIEVGQMQGMQMDDEELITMRPKTFLQEIVLHGTSGTDAEPNSPPVPMLLAKEKGWTRMFGANAFVGDEQQSSPRGGDKFFSTNWLMGMAQRHAG